MGYSKPTEVSKSDLISRLLPTHAPSYTVIPHRTVVDNTISLLQNNGFTITKEIYKGNNNCNVAQGIYQIQSNQDSELGMMFAWTNSYDKSKRFQCAIGAYVFVCNNGMIRGDLANYSRKHTGTADLDVINQISSQVKHANQYFKQLIDDKENLKTITLSQKEQSELLGRLYAEKEILDVSQISIVKKEMNKPSYEYECDLNNAWTFYNHVTHSLKESHPRDWMSDQQKFHTFMTAEVLTQMGLHNSDMINDIEIQAEELIIRETGHKQMSIFDYI